MASATETLKEQVGITKRPITILEKLESMGPQIALALPKHLTPERMIRIAITCLRTNPKLAECEPQSILASVMLASQLGLEPGVLGQSFLVPYKKTCTLVPGWLGILDLVNRAGKATAWTGAVYKGDEFDWALGDKPFVTHRPCGDESQLTHVYAIARVKGSDYPIIEVWPMAKILKHRDRFNKVGDSHYSYSHFEMYARKVALLQALKYVPRSIQLATALALDDSAEMGTQHFDIKDVPNIIEGSFVPEPASEPGAKKEPDQKAAPEPPAMCQNCRKIGGHEKDCKFAAKVADVTDVPKAMAAPNKQAFMVNKIEHKKSTKKGEYLTISVITNEGSGLLYCWHKSIFPFLPLGECKPPAGLIAEISEQNTDDKKVFHQIEKVLEFAGVRFVDNKPDPILPEGIVEADPSESLFGTEE